MDTKNSNNSSGKSGIKGEGNSSEADRNAKQNQNKYNNQIELEQKKVDVIYENLDYMRDDAKKKLASMKKRTQTGTHQSRSERDSFANLYEHRINQLNSVENRLVFGKLKFGDDTTRYIGRIGLSDKENHTLITDWRAPAAEAFYRATPQSNEGVAIRRHITTDNRKVTSLEDEVLDVDSDISKTALKNDTLSGEGALFKRLTERRTGRMQDIVSTIQKEQDSIIRSDADGVLVVQGGPGTGKTAVALHRAAYLLYTKRETLQDRGILIIGPNKSFLYYIDQVIPSLGESGIVSTTIKNLLPNIIASRRATPEEKEIKGDMRMMQILKNAVADRRRVPKDDIIIEFESRLYTLTPDFIRETMQDVLKEYDLHNVGRREFVKRIIDHLLQEIVTKKRGAKTKEQKKIIEMNLRNNEQIRIVLNLIWTPVTGERLLGELWSKPHKLRRLAQGILSKEECKLLAQPLLSPWSPADVPLLDAVYDMLGPIEDEEAKTKARKSKEAKLSRDIAFTKELLSDSFGPSIDSQTLAERYGEETETFGSLRERAMSDRNWVYGHVIVDEAQELSPMEWQMLKKRCPSQSFTIVGDVAQKSYNPRGFTWDKALRETFTSDFRQEELTVNYRNPASIAKMAVEFGKENGLLLNQKASERDEEDSLEIIKTDENSLYEKTAKVATDFITEYTSSDGTGRVAIIAKEDRLLDIANSFYDVAEDVLDSELVERLDSQEPWQSQLLIASPVETKGLEFDAVIFVEPHDFVVDEKAEKTGLSDILVAITRSTKKLAIVHCKDLPAGLEK